MKFKWPYFVSAWGYSQLFGHAGSPIGIVHADMTLTRSEVKVMGLLNFRKLWLWLQVRRKKPCVLAVMTVSPLAGLFFITSALYNSNFHWTSIEPVYDYRVLLAGFLLPRKSPVLN